jgi:hypothetical protein
MKVGTNLEFHVNSNIRAPNMARGRAVAEAVSRWIPTAAAPFRARVWKVGFVVDKVAGFLRVLRFPLPKPFIPPTSPLSSQSPGAVSRGLVTS